MMSGALNLQQSGWKNMSIYVLMRSVLINIPNLYVVALYEFLIILSTEFSPQVRQTAGQKEINFTSRMFQSFHTSGQFLRGFSDDQNVARFYGTSRSLRRLQGPTTGHILCQNKKKESPATGHLDTGFSWFPCVYKQVLRWFPRFQVATMCFSCSSPNLNSVVTNFMFCIHVK